MMKTIQQKYSRTKLEYNNLDNLAFEVIREKKHIMINKETSFWNTDTFLPQTIVFDLKELCLLSRIHILDANIMRIDLSVAAEEKGPFIKVERDMEIISGKVRIIKVGSLPCQYFKLTVTRGSHLKDFKKIECFGLHTNDIKNKYDEDTLDLLFYNSYDLIYKKKDSESEES